MEAERESLVCAHFAPSAEQLQKLGNAAFRPLKSESYPDGLPGLSQQEAERVRKPMRYMQPWSVRF